MLLHLCQFGDDRLVTSGGLIYCDTCAGRHRQEYIHAGTEFDKTHVLVNIALFFGLGIGDNASGHGTGNLAHQNILALRCGDYDVAFGSHALW